MEHKIKYNVESDDHLNFKYSMSANIEWIILSKCHIFLLIYLPIGWDSYLDHIKRSDYNMWMRIFQNK
jgi:hypothetical protein